MGLVINAGLMALLTGWSVNYLFAQIVASCAALVWNFLAARFLVFRS
jgi:putative flippase GtrA